MAWLGPLGNPTLVASYKHRYLSLLSDPGIKILLLHPALPRLPLVSPWPPWWVFTGFVLSLNCLVAGLGGTLPHFPMLTMPGFTAHYKQIHRFLRPSPGSWHLLCCLRGGQVPGDYFSLVPIALYSQRLVPGSISVCLSQRILQRLSCLAPTGLSSRGLLCSLAGWGIFISCLASPPPSCPCFLGLSFQIP